MNKDITLEDLGYAERIKNSQFVLYVDIFMQTVIRLNLTCKTVMKYFFISDMTKIEEKTELTFIELQAIHNKCKDSGWLDE